MSVRINLLELPDIPLIRIAAFLGGRSLINFSHTCRKLFQICNQNKNCWRRAIEKEKFGICPEIRDAAEALIKSGSSTHTKNVEKLTYLMHKRTQLNLSSGKLPKIATIAIDKVTGMFEKQKQHSGKWFCLEVIPKNKLSSDKKLVIHVWDVIQGKLNHYQWNTNKSSQMLYNTFMDYVFIDSTCVLLFTGEDTISWDLIALKTSASGDSMEPLWHHSGFNSRLFQTLECNKTSLFNLFIDKGSNKMTLDVVGIRTGHHIAKHKIDTKSAKGILSLSLDPVLDEDWIVLAFQRFSSADERSLEDLEHKLYMMNLEANTLHQIKISELTSECLEVMALKSNKLVGCTNKGFVYIWDLKSSCLVKKIQVFQQGEQFDIWHLPTFDPVSQETSFLVKKLNSCDQLVRLVGDDRFIYKFSPKTFTNLYDKQFAFGYLIRFKQVVKCKFKRIKKKLFVVVIPVETPWIEKTFQLNLDDSESLMSLDVIVAPTLIAIRSRTKVFLIDLLNLKQFRDAPKSST